MKLVFPTYTLKSKYGYINIFVSKKHSFLQRNWLSLSADCTQQIRQADESRNTDQLDFSYRCFDL